MSESPPTAIFEDQQRLIGYAMGTQIATALPKASNGVIVESPPGFDAATCLKTLNDQSELTMGVALVDIDEADVDTLQHDTAATDNVRVTDVLSTAVKWRNGTETDSDWEGETVPDRIVVIVRGDPAKLGSLHRLTGLPLGKVRTQITKLIAVRPEFDNAAAQAVCEALDTGVGEDISLREIADYAVHALRDDAQSSLEALEQELHRLGLFADPNLLGDATAVPDRLSENAETVSRIKHITNRDNRRLMNSIRQETGDDRQDQAEFVEKLRRFHRTTDDSLLAELAFDDVRAALNTKSQSAISRPDGEPEPTDDDTDGDPSPDSDGSSGSSSGRGRGGRRYTRRTDDASVGVELALDDNTEELDELGQDLEKEIDDAIQKEERRVEITFGDDQMLLVDADSDLHYFLSHFVAPDHYGGIVRDINSRNDAVTNFSSKPTERFSITGGAFEKLERFAERNQDFQSIVDAIDATGKAREPLTEYLSVLTHSPLVALLGDEDLLKTVEEYIAAYQSAQKKLDNKYRSLQDESAKGAAQLLNEFLLLDTLIIETESGRELVLSPLHPLHLWKYAELAREVTDQNESLSDEEREFLQEAVEDQPHVLNNITVGGNRLLDEKTLLVQSDEYANLPVYTEVEQANAGSNEYLWEYIIEKFSAAYPPSARHLKLSVVNPIDPVDVLTDIVDIADSGQIAGATVEFAYVGQEQEPLLGKATSAQEESIIELFGSGEESGDFTIKTTEHHDFEGYARSLADKPQHFIVVNDKSRFYVEEFERDFDTAIHPLYVPKEFDYDSFEDEIQISPSNEGELFSEYQNLTNQLYNQRQKLHTAGVHELETGREAIEQLQEHALWVGLSTPPMNTDQFWDENLVSRERRGDREYGIYSEDLSLFIRTLRRLLKEYPIAPDSANVEEIARRIADTERSGLLRLITEETIGSAQSRNTQGLLGSIIAVQWLDEQFSDPKLIFSIDDPRTREWLNFGDLDRRADILVVQPDEDDGLVMQIVEVKARTDPDVAFSIEQQNGSTVVSGDAIEQVMLSSETVRGLFETDDEGVATPPRREALREQLYYELIESDVPGDKQDWTDRVNRVFQGDAQISVQPRILSVELTNNDPSDAHLECETEDAQRVWVDRLPRDTIVRLLVNGKDKQPDAPADRPSAVTNGTEEDTSDRAASQVADDDATSSERVDGETSNEQDQIEAGGPETPDASSTTDTDSTSQTASSPDSPLSEECRPSEDGEPAPSEENTSDQPTVPREQVEELKRVLADFDIDVRDIDPNKADVGPNIIRYKIELAHGQKQDAVERRTEDIAREMALEHRPVVQRLPGTEYVALDVPRSDRDVVDLVDYLDTLPASSEIGVGELPFVAGVRPAGDAYVARLDEAPHMLVGGATGSGKTIFLHSLIASLLERQPLENFRLALIDPKLTNFVFYNRLPNLEHDTVITDPDAAFDLFEWIVDEELQRRTEVLAQSKSVDIGEHNERSEDTLRPLVVVIDEYADLVDSLEDRSDDFETNVRRIAQRARSVGIHLVVATQRPSANIIDTDLRANLNMRVGFRLPQASDSNIILDESGAEKLGGNGDMLLKEADSVTRLQGTFTGTDYLRDLVSRVADRN